METSADSNDARRAVRRRADAPSTLRGSVGGPIDTFVHDVSRTGVKIECAADLVLGEFVSIGLAGIGSARAIVVWKRDRHVGLDFVTPLSADDAAKAFVSGTVVDLAAVDRPSAADEQDESRQGIYSNGLGWLGGLTTVVVAGSALGAMLLRGWIL